ncbi:MAG TPA: hypothetical protein VIY48_07760 [Candidatus Paceibacterota bacterium]
MRPYRTREEVRLEQEARSMQTTRNTIILALLVGGVLWVVTHYRYEDVLSFVIKLWNGG